MNRKRLRLLAAAVIVVILACAALAACNNSTAGTSGGDTLKIYNWEDYIDPDLLDEFAEYYRSVTGRALEITYTTFDTNETMMTKVLKGDANVDLICPSEYAIQKLMSAGLVKNLNDVRADIAEDNPTLDIDALLAGFGNVEPDVMEVIRSMFGSISAGGKTYDMTEYMVPYMWGTLGILYNKKYVSVEELEQYGWGILWNAGGNPDLEGNILVKDSIRDTYCAAVLYLKEYDMLPDAVSSVDGLRYDELPIAELINCTDDVLLAAAEKALTEQREHIAGYEVDFGKDDMLNEIVYLDLAWSGDALWAVEESYDEDTDDYMLGYYVPEIGANIWYDGWIIPTSATNDLAAMMFIDYMCRPESGARNSAYIGYTSAVARDIVMTDADAAAALIDNEYLWYASSEECTLHADPASPDKLLFRYEWTEGDVYYLYADGTEADATDDSGLLPLEPDTDEEGYWLLDGERIIDADSMNIYFFDEGRYPEITDNLGVMRDFGASNDKVVQMWERAKAGTDTPWELIWCLIAVAGIVGLGLGAYFLKEYLKRRPRKIPDGHAE